MYFRKELHAHPSEDVQKIWDLVTEDYPRYLVNIDPDADENEQKIFDTVNSFGVRLSEFWEDFFGSRSRFRDMIKSDMRTAVDDTSDTISNIKDRIIKK